MLKIGTCGWGYINSKKDKLVEYIKNGFNAVEVNYSFYSIPKPSTLLKWREKADKIREDFEFTFKVYKGITHFDKLNKKSYEYFEVYKKLARCLRAKLLLFQFPKSFKPTKENISKFKTFFSKIDREEFLIAVELRWKDDWKKEIVFPLFSELNLIHSVDPFRQNQYSNSIHYYRIHGLGKPIMYDYKFSEVELKNLIKHVNSGYVFFNNYFMYEDALRFKSFLLKRK